MDSIPCLLNTALDVGGDGGLVCQHGSHARHSAAPRNNHTHLHIISISFVVEYVNNF